MSDFWPDLFLMTTPKKADGNKDTLAGMFLGLLYLFDVPTFLSSLTNFIQTYASLYPKQVGRKS